MATPRRFRWGFAVLAVFLVALLAGLWFLTHQPPKQGKPPPVAVSVARAQLQDMPVTVSGLGQAQAWQSVLINTQVNGKLLFVAGEGVDVKAGDVLAQIDCAPYQATLLQAQGALHRDQALLQGARVDLARFQTLAAQDSIARQQLDDQAALVKQDEGTVQLDQGQVASAQVNVRYCRITSPVSGRVGVRLIDAGNIVSTSVTTGIVSVNQTSPIAVVFSVPQGDFARLSQASSGFTVPLFTQAFSQETAQPLGAGALFIADNHVDPTTGTVQLKARFANDDRALWPGQFITVKMTLQTLHNVVVVPAAAVTQGPNGPYVYVVGADNKVAMHPVVVTTTQDGVAVIQSGVKAGDTVVTDGQMSLKPGVTVAVHAVAPAAKRGGA
jgi:membrane fusion protein, multidrug efflux system